MVACFGVSARQIARLSTALPIGTSLTIASDWSTFERQAAGCDCAVVWLAWLGKADDFRHLLIVRAHLPNLPLVLVTQRDADNARRLKDLSVEEVLWYDEAPRALGPAVRRARARGMTSALGAELARLTTVPPPLRRALSFACRSERPVRTVAQLAEIAGCDRRTLWRYWREGGGQRDTLPLQDVLHWLLLLRAVGRKSPAVSWHAVAAELGVHPHTLARLASRLGGWTLRELAVAPCDRLIDRCCRAILDSRDPPRA